MESISTECFVSITPVEDVQPSGEAVKFKDKLDTTSQELSFETNHRSEGSPSREGACGTSIESPVKKVCDDKQKGILNSGVCENLDEFWLCAICRDRIVPKEIAQIKGCQHAYCVICILRWASYNCWCPQCKLPFSFLFVHKALDGSVHDHMSEESVCLLLRASWFKPVPIEFHEGVEENDDCQYEDDIYDEYYYTSSLRIGNRRWGDNGYVRAGRKEARPVGICQVRGYQNEIGGSSSRPNKEKESAKEVTGRRAKRALKREAADKAAAAKHQQHLQRLNRS